MHEFAEKSFVASLHCVCEGYQGPVVAVDSEEEDSAGRLRCEGEGEAVALIFSYLGSGDAGPQFKIVAADTGAALGIDFNGSLGLYSGGDACTWQLEVLVEGDDQTPARVQFREGDADLVLVDGGIINTMDGMEGVFELHPVE
jgi:hypothetical protein